MAHLSEKGVAICSVGEGGGDDDGTPRKPRWMRPANRPSADDPADSPRPETVLLDTVAYIDDETNATTASATRSDGRSQIQVTFWIVPPPRVSYYTVHCPGLTPDAFPKLPRVVATEDDLALLRVPASPEHNLEEDRRSEFFLYRAGTGGNQQQPRLRLLPNPSPRYYADKEIGILNCPADDRFFLVVLHRNPFTSPMTLYIHMFDSRTWHWDTKQVSPPDNYSYCITDKVFTIGGRYGSMAWVDLWRGIFIYDVILGGDTIVYKPLPSSGLPTLKGLGRTVRDVIAVNGFIRYFCMYSPGVDTTNVEGDWHAYAWRMKYPLQQDWQQDCHFKASEIMMDNNLKRSELLQDTPNGVEKPSLMLRAGSPVLSLHDVDVVYILTKPLYIDDMAWVHAVNMSTKTVQGIAEFSAERTVGFMFTYIQSAIFKPKVIEVKEDSHENEEDSWTLVSYKKKNGAPAGARHRLPSEGGMRQRGHQMGLNNGRGCQRWSRPHNGAGREGYKEIDGRSREHNDR